MYSIVIPVFNEHETIPQLHSRLAAVIDTLDAQGEIIFVDDGSTDNSFEVLLAIHHADPRLKIVRLSRNFGHQAAISAGIDCAGGDAVILMDGDLQDPPEILPKFIAKWREGFDVVYGIHKKRKENVFKRIAYAAFYRILSRLSYLDIPLDSGDFCLMNRRVVHAIRQLPERNRFVRGIRTWVGFQQAGIEYERDRRFAGTAKYTFKRLLKLAYDGIFSFSTVPLRLAVYTGFFFSTLAFLAGLFIIYQKLVHQIAVVGWASTIAVTTFLGGLILMMMGIIGEYIGRIVDEVKQRPVYVIRDKVGL